MSKFESHRLVVSDPEGRIFDHPDLKLAGRSGERLAVPLPNELVPLPSGSQLFSMPGRTPVGWDDRSHSFLSSEKVWVEKKEMECTAVAAFLPPGYIRTFLPATQLRSNVPTLPLWAYSAVGWKDGRFWAPGLLIDPNPQWNPEHFQNYRLLRKIGSVLFKKNLNESSSPATGSMCA